MIFEIAERMVPLTFWENIEAIFLAIISVTLAIALSRGKKNDRDHTDPNWRSKL